MSFGIVSFFSEHSQDYLLLKMRCCLKMFVGEMLDFCLRRNLTKYLNITIVSSVLSVTRGGNNMATLTLAIPEDMKVQMDKCAEINWSEVARGAIRQKLAQLVLFKAIVAKSKLTEEDAIELGKKINKSMHEKLKKKYPEAY